MTDNPPGVAEGEKADILDILLQKISGGGGDIDRQSAEEEIEDRNVVAREVMKRTDAVIGGEGNGGVILPDLHYGRDALVGIAIFLTLLVKSRLSCSQLRATYPNYYMSKQKADLDGSVDMKAVFDRLETKYSAEDTNNIDGLKIDFAESWVHLRKSNTEPIIRIYSEAKTQAAADALADSFKAEIETMVETA